ncbi:C39 family peptidase [Anaerolineales bacterium HSG24]|nr:C39 family peptidase [Anaerolineales bacterium HSG24]
MRERKPYNKKNFSWLGLFFFIISLIAIIGMIVMVMMVSWPALANKTDSLSYRAGGYYKRMFPPPQYLPTPAPIMVNQPQSLPEKKLELTVVMHDSIPTATFTPKPTATPRPTSWPSSTSSPTTTPTMLTTPTVTPRQVQLTKLTHQYQTWNNCGPATITMNMTQFGYTNSQAEAATFLKPNRDDKNVSPQELMAYARQHGLQAIVRQGGSLETLKALLNNDLPVLVEFWFTHDGDEMGHYRLITGYDDTTQQLIVLDSYNGPNIRVDYDTFEAEWRVFNYLYGVIYLSEQVDIVAEIIGADMDDTHMYERLVGLADDDLALNPDDRIAYFNKGDALTRLGRFDEAAAAFDEARHRQLHWRRLWYQFTPFEAYYQVERYQDVIDLSQATLNSANGLEEGYYYLGLALHATGQLGAAENFRAALTYNANFSLASDALAALEAE